MENPQHLERQRIQALESHNAGLYAELNSITGHDHNPEDASLQEQGLAILASEELDEQMFQNPAPKLKRKPVKKEKPLQDREVSLAQREYHRYMGGCSAADMCAALRRYSPGRFGEGRPQDVLKYDRDELRNIYENIAGRCIRKTRKAGIRLP